MSFVVLKSLTREASSQGWSELLARLRERVIFNPEYIQGARWDSAHGVTRETGHLKLALKPWLAATAECALAWDMRRRDLTMARLNPDGLFQMADMLAGVSVAFAILGQASGGALAKTFFPVKAKWRDVQVA